MRRLFMAIGAAFAIVSAFGDVQPGQLERDASDQTALLDGVSVIQSGYVYGAHEARLAFDGDISNFVNLISVKGSNASGTNTAYGVDFGEHGACVLTSAKVLSRNASCWERSKDAVICGSNDLDWFHNFDILTSPTTHTGSNQWNEVVSTSTRAYRYLFIYNPDPAAVVYGPETSEIQFFGYNVVATAGAGGSVKMGEEEAVQSVTAYATAASPVTLTAVPAEGYAFAKWTGRISAIVGGTSTNATIQVESRGELRALFRTTSQKAPGQIERDASDQTALYQGIDTIQSGYNWNANTSPIKAFNGVYGSDYVNLTYDKDKKDGTRTAYGIDFGTDGSCILTSARVLSRNSNITWTRSIGAVICGSSSTNWFTNFEEITLPTTHTGSNQWNTVSSTSKKEFRRLFIYNPDPAAVVYGPETSEIQFFGYNVVATAGAGGSVKLGDDAASSYIAAYASPSDPLTVTAIPDEGYSFLRWEGRIHAIVGGSSADATIQVGQRGELRAVFTAAERKEVGQLERVPSDQTVLAEGISVVSTGYVYSAHSPICAFDGDVESFVNLTCDAALKDGTKTGYGVDFGENGACILAYAQILGRSSAGFTRVAGAVICGSNDPDWFGNFEIVTTATAPTDGGQWNTVDSISTNAYRYFFIYNPDSTVAAYGPQTAEIRFFGYNVRAAASGMGKIRLGDGEAASFVTAYANADNPATLTAVPDDEGFRFARWEGRTEAIVSGNVRSAVIQVGAHAQLTAVFERRPGTLVIIR